MYHDEEWRYNQYLNEVINHHIESFAQISWNEGDQEFQNKLFCLLIQVSPKTEGDVGRPSQELLFVCDAKF